MTTSDYLTPPAAPYPAAPQPMRRRRPRSPWPQTLAVLVPLGILLAVLGYFNTLAAGVVYSLSIMILSFWRPQWALMLAFGLAPFTRDLPIPGPLHISIGEFTMALCVPAFLVQSTTRLRFPGFLFAAMLYLCACVFTTLVNVDKAALAPLVQMVLYLVVTVLVYSSLLGRPDHFLMVLDGSLAITAVLAILVSFDLGEAFELHKNSFGATMADGLLIALECWFAASSNRKRRRYLFLLVLLFSATLLYSLSRGAWMAALAGALVIVSLRRQFKLVMQIAIIAIPLVVILFFTLPEDKQDYAISTDTSRVNYSSRLEVIRAAKQAFVEKPIAGQGISYRKYVDATNIIFISLAESGVLGFATFVLLNAAVLRFVWKTQKIIPRNHLLYSPVALGGALVIAHLAHGLVDHYWSRGPLLQAWATAGMATGVYYIMRPRKKRKNSQFSGFPALPSEAPLNP